MMTTSPSMFSLMTGLLILKTVLGSIILGLRDMQEAVPQRCDSLHRSCPESEHTRQTAIAFSTLIEKTTGYGRRARVGHHGDTAPSARRRSRSA